MKGKLIRNTLLLLIIPLAITLIIVFTNNKQYGFSATVDRNGTSYTETTDLNRTTKKKEFVETFNENYTAMMFSAIILVIIFVIFYNFLTKKKGW